MGNTYGRVSEEKVSVVRRMWEAFLQNDFETSLAAFHTDVEWDGTNLPDGTISRGRWAEMWETWDASRAAARPGCT
jgi:hypothetical protein